MTTRQLPSSQKDARRRRFKRFFTGKPCRRGHVAPRLVLSGNCTECVRAWRKENADRWAALAGQASAHSRFPGCVPRYLPIEDTIPFYARARRLTMLTGIKHEVDHVVALSLGGMHVASNLQVITKAANRAKAKVEKVEVKRRCECQ